MTWTFEAFLRHLQGLKQIKKDSLLNNKKVANELDAFLYGQRYWATTEKYALSVILATPDGTVFNKRAIVAWIRAVAVALKHSPTAYGQIGEPLVYVGVNAVISAAEKVGAGKDYGYNRFPEFSLALLMMLDCIEAIFNQYNEVHKKEKLWDSRVPRQKQAILDGLQMKNVTPAALSIEAAVVSSGSEPRPL